MELPADIAAACREVFADGAPVCVLSGAGMSAESGMPTFRGGIDSLWSRFDPQRLATAQAWTQDPALVWAWYRWRMHLVRQAQPHAGHRALATLAGAHGSLSIITQNVDDLHERAGSVVDAHVHGELFALRCFRCGRAHAGALPAYEPDRERVTPPTCQACGDAIRPGVVWFGEALPDDAWTVAVERAAACALMLVVGTSGLVHPAASLPSLARRNGAVVVEINPESTALSGEVDHVWHAPAAIALPLLEKCVAA